MINFVILGSEQGQRVTIKTDKTTYAQAIDQICVQTGRVWRIEFNEESGTPFLIIKESKGQQDGGGRPASRPESNDHASLHELVWIAEIGATDVSTQRAIEKLMGEHHIKCYMWGSFVYGVEVSKKDANEAKILLKNDKAIAPKVLKWLPNE